MTNWQPGMSITALRLMDGIDPTTTTTGVVAATGFTVSTFSAKRSGKQVWVNLVLQRTGANIGESSAGSGRLATQPVAATLPSGWWPPETITAMWGTVTNDGRAVISPAGVITLSTTSGSAGIATNDSLRLSETWLVDT